jgi:signal transduction histidine kinase
MSLDKLTTFNQKKATAFMDEKSEQQAEKEKAIIAIVHEIRNPLTAVKLTNQLMQHAFDSQEHDRLRMQSYMMIVAQNIERIERHLKEALTYKSRETILQAVNICDCLDRAVGQAQDRLYLSGITLHSNYSGDHWVHGNAEKLIMAFLNLIINSVEAIKSEKGKIWISVYEANNTLRITFKDNGIGMQPDIAEKIFDPSFSTKDGIGIGLFNVKEIMNLHKAHIVADSLPDVGTSISILFNSAPEEENRAK